MHRFISSLLFVAAAGLMVGCQAVAPKPAAQGAAAAPPAPGATLVVAAHDSLAVSDPVVKAFEEANNVKIQFLQLGDAGEALNKVILSKSAPLADVFFGVDNTLLSRALEAGIFEPYASPLLSTVPADFQLDPSHQLTPVDHGYVNINADRAWFAKKGIPVPQTLEDLIKPEYKGLLVVENPAGSSPGLAFLLTTIAHFGEDKYLDYWKALRANDTLVSDNWNDAYYTHFTVGAGDQGDRPLVVSYTTSPPADVVFAKDGRTEPASVNVSPAGGAFHQIEFVGVLKGAKQPELARKFVDYMLDSKFQADIPLQMFVYPVVPNTPLPDVFTKFGQTPAQPAQVDPKAIEQNRERWTKAWADVMLH